MLVSTIEDDFEYQMKKVIEKIKNDYSLKHLDAEKLRDKIWEYYATEFGRAVLEACNEYSGDELFE